MKVLHILHSLKYSGAEIMYVDAASFFQKKGCKLSVVATATDLGEYAPKFKVAGYDVYHKPYPIRSHFINRIFYLIGFIYFLREYDFDIVHIHVNRRMFWMAFCVWIAGRRSVYTFHNVFPTHLLTRPLHIAIRWIAKKWWKCKFQTISNSVYENELKIFKNKTIKINNWFSSSRYFSGGKEEKRDFRKKIGVDQDAFVLVSVGGCSPIKRHSDIIKALPAILKEIPNCIYLHLGTGKSEDEEKELAKQLGVYDNILFAGNQVDVRKYLVASDIYMMTSKFEGISLTTIEAMACGIPTILYDVPGLRDFNDTVKTTILIQENFHLLADKVVEFYKSRTIRNQYIVTAKDFVKEEYGMKNNAEKIYQLYIEDIKV